MLRGAILRIFIRATARDRESLGDEVTVAQLAGRTRDWHGFYQKADAQVKGSFASDRRTCSAGSAISTAF